MKSKLIPAQITTVEDKIAGNFSFSQIIILLIPIFFACMIYALLPPSMMFVWYKLMVIAVFALFILPLAIRIKGKIILSWLVSIFRFTLRPKYYVFDKQSSFSREAYLPGKINSKKKAVKQKAQTKTAPEQVDIREVLQLNHLLQDSGFNLIYRASKKGGLNVAFEKISK